MDRLYYYLFYGSFTLMPILLLLILLTKQRCLVWSKRCAGKLDAIRVEVESVKYSLESAITRYLSDCVSDKIHTLVSEMVENHNRENDFQREVRLEEVASVPACEEPQTQPLKPFDINDLPKMEPEFGEKYGDAILEALAFEESYTDKYITRAAINFNGIGMKRVTLSPGHWSKLMNLGFVREEPVSVSAILYNILEEHFKTYGKEIEPLAIIGNRNMKYGYGRN